MHRIDTPTAQKDKFGAGKNGFTRGNPQTGTPATDLDDDYFDMLQEELAGIVEATGIALAKSNRTQILTALKALFLSRSHPFADIKNDGAAAIAEALTNLGLKEAAKRDVGTGTNQIPDMASFAGLKGSNGHKTLPGGDLFQWGIIALKTTPAGTTIGTFPKAFPVAGQQILVTHDNPQTGILAFGSAQIINTTQFRVNAMAIDGATFTMVPAGDVSLRWFAVGS